MLLNDYFKFDVITVINEDKSKNVLKIRGVFGRADEFNNNNRRYPKSLLDREIKKLNPLISERRLLGELDHPEYTNVKLTNASHLITKIGWEGNKLIGEAEILNTPSGKVAQQLLKDGVRLGISSRGLGSLKEAQGHPGKQEVDEDYKMVTFDLVADPSTRGAFPNQVTESVEHKAAYEKTKKQALSEAILLTLLKDKIDKIREGMSTGENPLSTGIRVGKFLKKSLKSGSKSKDYSKFINKSKQADRIGNKIYTKSKKSEQNPDIAVGLYHGSKAAMQEGLSPQTKDYLATAKKGGIGYHDLSKWDKIPKKPKREMHRNSTKFLSTKINNLITRNKRKQRMSEAMSDAAKAYNKLASKLKNRDL